MTEQVLSGIKVLDLSSEISGPWCTRMLAGFGADVIKVEDPNGGDIARKMGPFPDDIPDLEKSGLFLYMNTGKKSITLNIRSSPGLEILQKLIKESDVLVENFQPGTLKTLGIDYQNLVAINPGLILTSITNFGQTGPYSDYKASSIVDYSLSGHQFINGEPTREPLQAPPHQPEYQGGLHGFLATLVALYHRIQTAQGQWVDVSIQECMAGFHQFTITRYTYGGLIKQRGGNRYESDHPISIYPCKDGYVAVSASARPQQEQLYTLIGRPELIEDQRFATPLDRIANADAFDELLKPWLKERTKDELFHTLNEWRIPCAPVSEPEDLLKDPHFKERKFWVNMEHPQAGVLSYPGAPFTMTETPMNLTRAPLLGEHNENIYCDHLGHTLDDLVIMRGMGVI